MPYTLMCIDPGTIVGRALAGEPSGGGAYFAAAR
jgi:hypothetical protein